MTTSGSHDFAVTRNDIIHAALRLTGSKRRGITVEAEELSEASEALNMMVKAWQAQGYHLWKLREITVFLQDTSQSLSIGPAGNAAESHVQTTTSVAAASAASTITVTSDTGISDGDIIGVELDSGALQWTTVNGAPASDVITLTDVLTGAVASGNWVYAYTTRSPRPLRILEARVRESGGNDIPIEIVSRQFYFDLPNKDSEGKVNQIYYDPQLVNGVLYLWPTTSTVRDRLYLTAYLPLEDFDSESDTPDFPQEWFEALKFGLASRIGMEKGLSMQRQSMLDVKAGNALMDALAFDDGEESVYIQPEDRLV